MFEQASGQSVKAQSVELVVKAERPYLLDISSHYNTSVKACRQELALLLPNKLAAGCLYEVFVGAALSYTCSLRKNPLANLDEVADNDAGDVDWKFRELFGEYHIISTY